MVNIKAGRVVPVPMLRDDLLGGESPGTIFMDRAGSVWMLFQRQVIHYHRGTVRVFKPQMERPELGRLLFMAQDSAGVLWAGSRYGHFLRFDPGNEGHGAPRFVVAHQVLPADPGVGAYLFQDRQKQAWIAQGRNVGILSGAPSSFRREQQFDLSYQVRDLYEDREGNVWAGTDGGGLVGLRPALFNVYGADAGLSYDVTLSLTAAPDGSLWVGTNCGGLNHLVGGRFTPYVDPVNPARFTQACIQTRKDSSSDDP